MVFGSHAKTRAIYSTPPCPSLAASTAAYRRRSFSDSHPKKRCIFPSISAEYPSTSYSLLRDLLRRQDTTAQAIREVILNHILNTCQSTSPVCSAAKESVEKTNITAIQRSGGSQYLPACRSHPRVLCGSPMDSDIRRGTLLHG